MTDNSDLTDDAVLKMLIERGRATIVKERADAVAGAEAIAHDKAENQRIMDYIKKYGTDEG